MLIAIGDFQHNGLLILIIRTTSSLKDRLVGFELRKMEESE